MGMRINDLPIEEPRESKFELEELRRKLSIVTEQLSNNKTKSPSIDAIESFLCLANEISEIKRKLNDHGIF